MRLGQRSEKRNRVGINLVAALTLLGVLGAATPRLAAPRDAQALSDFVEKNHTLLRYWLAQPPSLARDQHIQAIHENVRWAEECQAGHNSDQEASELPLDIDSNGS